MIEAKRRHIDLPEMLSIGALVCAGVTLLVFGGVVSTALYLVAAVMGSTRIFEKAAADGKPTLSRRARLLIGVVSATLATTFHPGLSVSHPAPVAISAQAPTKDQQTAKAPEADPAETKKKLASLVAGERELERQDFEGRLTFWDQIVALAPENAAYAAQRAEVKLEVDEMAIYREHPELGAEIVEISNRLEGFGVVSMVNVKIRNRALSHLKDFQISCDQRGASGTVIGRTKRTLYEVVPARSTRSFRNVNMGLVSPQSKRFSCRIDGASVA